MSCSRSNVVKTLLARIQRLLPPSTDDQFVVVLLKQLAGYQVNDRPPAAPNSRDPLVHTRQCDCRIAMPCQAGHQYGLLLDAYRHLPLRAAQFRDEKRTPATEVPIRNQCGWSETAPRGRGMQNLVRPPVRSVRGYPLKPDPAASSSDNCRIRGDAASAATPFPARGRPGSGQDHHDRPAREGTDRKGSARTVLRHCTRQSSGAVARRVQGEIQSRIQHYAAGFRQGFRRPQSIRRKRPADWQAGHTGT